MQTAKSDFQIALSAYQLVINQGAENFSEQATAVSEEITKLQNSKKAPRDTVKAASPVYFVSYADRHGDGQKEEQREVHSQKVQKGLIV